MATRSKGTTPRKTKTPKKVDLVKAGDVWAELGNAPKEYKLLNKVNDYDHDVANEIVEAMNEIALLNGRVAFLQNLVDSHKRYQKFVWRTAEGVNIALHNIEDDHLLNILKHVTERGAVISKEMRAEALSRGFSVPVQHLSKQEYNRDMIQSLMNHAAEAHYRNVRGDF